jgi:nondiscriminating glutamyl-tRNA synthetase
MITRFPPSPTGYLHIWSVRTALFNRFLARKHHGKFIYRLEDTDYARSTKEYENNMTDWLKRLGLYRDYWPWADESKWPYHQMERLDIYKERLQKLLDTDKAYYSWETSEELDEMRAICDLQKKPFVYKKPIYTPDQIRKFQEEWRIPAIRLSIKKWWIISFEDKVKWIITVKTDDIGDFVIVKGDGIPTYHFAVVVDDITMGVTHVIRWEDHVSNTPKHILIYEAFGYDIPIYAHLPLLMNPQWWKMSKRDENIGLVLIHNFKEAGILPDAIINFVAFLGRNPWWEKEFYTRDELIDAFSLERVVKSNAVYDFNRALWFNSQYLSRMEDSEFVSQTILYLNEYGGEIWKPYIENIRIDYWISFARYIKVRIQTLAQFRDFCLYFFQEQPLNLPVIYSEKMKCDKETVDMIVPKIIELLESINIHDRNEEVLKIRLIELIQANSLKNWQVLWPIRAILTWVEASPWAFEMLEVLWKEESIKRLMLY